MKSSDKTKDGRMNLTAMYMRQRCKKERHSTYGNRWDTKKVAATRPETKTEDFAAKNFLTNAKTEPSNKSKDGTFQQGLG